VLLEFLACHHAATCAICQAREDYLRARLPPLPPPPLPPFAEVLVRFNTLVRRLPLWARPAAYGAAIVGAIVFVRFLLTLLAVGFSMPLLAAALFALLTGAYAGAVGGIAYQFARGPTRRLGRGADYVLGIIIVLAYTLALIVPFDLFGDNPLLRDRGTWVALPLLVVVIGLVVGYVIHRRHA
jgi:hypothetical protein